MNGARASIAGRLPLRRLLPNLRLRVGAVITTLFILIALVSLLWTPHPIDQASMPKQLLAASGDHWLGTDQLGRDSLSVLMVSFRNSLAVAVFAAIIGLLLGAPLGIAAALRSGWLDKAVFALNDFLVVFSAMVVAMVLTALGGPGTLNAVVAIGLADAAVFALALRHGVVAFRDADYVAAARLTGLSGWTAAQLHLLPRLTPYLLLLVVQQVGFGILVEAGLTYAGLGATAPGSTLGLLLRDAQSYLLLEPGLAVVPGLALLLLVGGLALAASGLRPMLDSRLARLGGDDGAA